MCHNRRLLGMGDYELRSWRGWHHHMTLVILAHCFLVRMQLKKCARADGAAGAPAADGGAAAAGV
jgi:SRSO17 transposase